MAYIVLNLDLLRLSSSTSQYLTRIMSGAKSATDQPPMSKLDSDSRHDRTFILRHPNPDPPLVFATHNPRIAHHLQAKESWKIREITCRPEEHPFVSTSSIIELADGTIKIDEEILRGDTSARNLNEALVSNGGFRREEVDLRCVGALARSRTQNVVDHWAERFVDGVIWR